MTTWAHHRGLEAATVMADGVGDQGARGAADEVDAIFEAEADGGDVRGSPLIPFVALLGVTVQGGREKTVHG